jgi:hypothetical protein
MRKLARVRYAPVAIKFRIAAKCGNNGSPVSFDRLAGECEKGSRHI